MAVSRVRRRVVSARDHRVEAAMCVALEARFSNLGSRISVLASRLFRPKSQRAFAAALESMGSNLVGLSREVLLCRESTLSILRRRFGLRFLLQPSVGHGGGVLEWRCPRRHPESHNRDH